MTRFSLRDKWLFETIEVEITRVDCIFGIQIPGHTVSQGSWVRYPVWQHTFVSPSAFSRRAVVSYWRKYVHEVLVNRLGGLSLPRKSVVRLTDRRDMTLEVYRGRKTTIQQQQPRHTRIDYNWPDNACSETPNAVLQNVIKERCSEQPQLETC